MKNLNEQVNRMKSLMGISETKVLKEFDLNDKMIKSLSVRSTDQLKDEANKIKFKLIQSNPKGFYRELVLNDDSLSNDEAIQKWDDIRIVMNKALRTMTKEIERRTGKRFKPEDHPKDWPMSRGDTVFVKYNGEEIKYRIMIVGQETVTLRSYDEEEYFAGDSSSKWITMELGDNRFEKKEYRVWEVEAYEGDFANPIRHF